MKRLIILSAVAFFCLVATAFAAGVKQRGTPPLPTYALPLHSIHDNSIASEGVNQVEEVIVDKAGVMMLKRIFGTHGYYSTLIRNDLKALYMIYPIDPLQNNGNDTICYSFAIPQPVPIKPPVIPPGAQFAGTAMWQGHEVNRFSFYLDTYTISTFTDAKDGSIRAVFNWEFQSQTQSFYKFQTGSECPLPPSSTFDVPPSCSPPTTQLDAEVAAGLIGTDFFSSPDGFAQRHKQFAGRYNLMTPKAHEMLASLKSRSGEEEEAKRKKTNLHAEVAAALSPAEHRYTEYDAVNAQRISDVEVDNSKYTSPVFLQGTCGCCWSASSVGAAELLWNKKHNRTNIPGKAIPLDFSLSVQSVIDCAHGDLNGTALIPSKGCDGGSPQVAMESIAKHGIPTAFDYPFDAVNGAKCLLKDPTRQLQVHYPISTHKFIKSNASQMEQAVMKYGSVVSFINMLQSFMMYTGGVYNDPACTPGMAHAVLIVGFGTDPDTGLKYWNVKNSFGKAWGDIHHQGFFKMARGKNMCGIEDFGIVAIP